jgi:histone H3
MVRSLCHELNLEDMKTKAMPPREAKAKKTAAVVVKNSNNRKTKAKRRTNRNRDVVDKGVTPKTPHTTRACRRRRRAGAVAVKEITKYQKSTDLLIPKVPFGRAVREIEEENRWYMRKKSSAKSVYQEAAEGHVVDLLDATGHIAMHSNRTTIMKKDLKLALNIRSKNGL